MKPCLRSIRKHSNAYDLEIIVIDNGSKDGSLDYLKSLSWIRLVERPEEGPENWPNNVFTSWDRGLEDATGDYYVSMHSDVFVKADDWLDPFLATICATSNAVASGSGKLKVEHPLYTLQKKIIGGTAQRVKKLMGKNPKIDDDNGRYPRDYCAMYDTGFLKSHKIRFAKQDNISGGHQVATQIWEHGGETPIFSVREMDRVLAHIAHGTTTLTDRIQLKRKHKQEQTNAKKEELFRENWIKDLIQDESLDR